ncbi:MAG TPA: beta-N-acetylhexosaminidase [Hyphomicrobium sp.]|nr:beta-N-acetylhexosaminidase [Hyphomicrobium sp.]
MQAALICGLSATSLTPDERAFFRDVQPAGVILFTRNCHGLEQIRALVSETREAVGAEDFLVLIDQEGGRVQRLRGALGRALPPARRYGDMFARDGARALRAARSVSRLIADDLRALGINTNCTPVLDMPVSGAHGVIGDRAYGTEPAPIIALAREVVAGHVEGGVVPVIKHIPGHGRACADSHLALPVVETPHAELTASDFVPFRALRDAPAAMTAHVVFRDIDAGAPATTSRRVTQDIIRGEIGFQGLLMSDDLSMRALSGPMRMRAESVIAAGCDLALHCNGGMDEMCAAAQGVPVLSGAASDRFARACTITRATHHFDAAEAARLLQEVLSEGAHSAQSPESV